MLNYTIKSRPSLRRDEVAPGLYRLQVEVEKVGLACGDGVLQGVQHRVRLDDLQLFPIAPRIIMFASEAASIAVAIWVAGM